MWLKPRGTTIFGFTGIGPPQQQWQPKKGKWGRQGREGRRQGNEREKGKGRKKGREGKGREEEEKDEEERRGGGGGASARLDRSTEGRKELRRGCWYQCCLACLLAFSPHISAGPLHRLLRRFNFPSLLLCMCVCVCVCVSLSLSLSLVFSHPSLALSFPHPPTYPSTHPTHRLPHSSHVCLCDVANKWEWFWPRFELWVSVFVRLWWRQQRRCCRCRCFLFFPIQCFSLMRFQVDHAH